MSIMFARAVVEVAKLYDLPAVGVRKEEDKKNFNGTSITKSAEHCLLQSAITLFFII